MNIFSLEAFPAELATEQTGGEFEEEFRRASRYRSPGRAPRMGSPAGPRPRPWPRPGKPLAGWPPRRPRPWPVAGATPWPDQGVPYPLPGEPTPTSSMPQGSEYVRWTQDCLNRVMSVQLPVDGVMSPATRSVLRRFQLRENLPVTGIAGPDSEQALGRACAALASSGEEPGQDEWRARRRARAGGMQDEAALNAEFPQLPGTTVGTAMRQALKQTLPGGAVPKYQDAGTLANLANVPSDKGLYLISFNAGATPRAYSGKANNLRQRLLQHRHCAQTFALPLANYRVLIAPLPGTAKDAVRGTEKKINQFVRRNYPTVFTNQRSEIEEAMCGEIWS